MPFFFWPAIRVQGPIVSVCWTNIIGFIFGIRPWCLGGGGGGAPAAPAPPAVPNCDLALTYIFNNQCTPRAQNCGPPNTNTGMFMSTSGPCTCEVAGSTVAGRTECLPPQFGSTYCETASNGASSQCILKCNSGYTLLTDTTVTPPRRYCAPDLLLEEDCATQGKELAFQKPGQPCTCVTSPISPANIASTQLCPPLQPPGSPNGQMTCRPGNSAWGTCEAICNSPFVKTGTYACL